MKKIGSEIKAGIWYTVGNFVNRGIAFISTPIFTRLLTQEEYGEFSNFTAWISLLAVITSLDLYASINRAYYDYEDNFESYISTISWISIFFSCLCYSIFFVFRNWAVNVFGMNFRYISMMFVYLIFSPATQYYVSWQRISCRYKTAIFVNLGSALFSLVLSIVTVLLFTDKMLGRVVGYVLPVVVVNLILYAVFFLKSRKIVWDMAKYALYISVPLIPHVLSGSILNNSDRFMIKRFCGSAELAIYSFASNCALVVSVFFTSINQAYIPWLYKKLKNKDESGIDQRGKILLLFVLSVTGGLMLLTPEMVYVLGGEKYADAIRLIPIIMLGYCFQFLYTFYVNLEFYCKKTITVSLGTMVAAGTNVVLNIVWIPKLGYMAAACTTLLSYVLLYLIHYMAFRRLPYKNIYSHKTLFLIICSFSVCCLVVEGLYRVLWLRYCVCLGYGILLGIAAYRVWVRKDN